VIVIDRGGIGAGMTARTTAHLATELDDFYSELINVRGEDEARIYHDSQVAAVNRIEAICRDEGIDADFERVDGYLFAPADKPQSELEEEYEACRRSASTSNGPIARPCPASTPAARCASPTRAGSTRPNICAGSLRRSRRAAGAFTRTRSHVGDEEKDGGVEITTEAGSGDPRQRRRVRDQFADQRQGRDPHQADPDRTYVVAGRVPKGSVADALVWDTYDAIIMSASSRSANRGPADRRRRRPQTGEMPRHRAADRRARGLDAQSIIQLHPRRVSLVGQVLEPVDFMPFSAATPGTPTSTFTPAISGMGSPTASREPDHHAADHRRA
jgi:hypothetical protein